MKCMDCGGSGMSNGLHGFIPCFRCNGSGVVSNEMPKWIDKGAALRFARADLRLTLFEASKVVGVSCARLDALEKGRVYNLDFEYPDLDGGKK